MKAKLNGGAWLPADYIRFRGQFQEATDPAFHPIEWLDDVMRSGAIGLHASENAAILFEVRDYPGGAKAVHGLVAAGDLEEIRSILIPWAEQWAKSIGCTHAIIESRSGWARALRDNGYELRQTVVRKEL
jgi:hypothetical protein